MTARLYEKRGTWHIVLIYTNQQGKRAQKWINTGLAIKGNSRRAKQMMARAITEWGPVLEDTGTGRPASETTQSLPLPRRNKVGFDSPSGILFADYLTTWLEDRKNKLAITTYGGYQQEIDRIARYFRQHNLYIEQIDEMVITNFYRYNRRHGLSENTLLHYQTIMNQTLRKAVKEKLIPLNPYAVLDQDVKPSHTHFVPETYDIADLEQLFTAMQGDPLALFILMDVTYGLRRSELLGLKWSAIDFENKNIQLWLGHSTYQTTADIYTHLDYRDKMNTANAAADMVLNIMHKNA